MNILLIVNYYSTSLFFLLKIGFFIGEEYIKFWTRKKFKGTNYLKKIVNPMRVPIETKESVRWLDNLISSTTLLQYSKRCVHIGDRESDIYELFCLAKTLNTNFVVRACHNRNIDDEYRKIEAKMQATPISGTHVIRLENDKNRKNCDINLDIKFQRVELTVPVDKKRIFIMFG